jgi:hypothetical protein
MSIGVGDRPMTIASFDPGFYEVAAVFAPDATQPAV